MRLDRVSATRQRRALTVGVLAVVFVISTIVAATTGRVLSAWICVVFGVPILLLVKVAMSAMVARGALSATVARLRRDLDSNERELTMHQEDVARLTGQVTGQLETIDLLRHQHVAIEERLSDMKKALAEAATASKVQKLEQKDLLDLEIRRERIRTNLAIARFRAESQSASGVILLMTPQRTGSTRLFDMLRTHPRVDVDRSAATWQSLGLRGRRYPSALSNVPGDSFELEVQPGVGAVIDASTQLGDPVGDARWFLEKAHPEFIDFDESALVAAVEKCRRAGTDVRLAYATRRPLDVMWSMYEFQQRDPSWYTWLDPVDIPDFVQRSFQTLLTLARQLPGPILDFDEGVDPGSPIEALGRELGVVDSRAWVVAAAEWVDERKATTATKQRFVGTRDSMRQRSGPDGIWKDQDDLISEAETAWNRIRAIAR